MSAQARHVFGTAALPGWVLLLLLPFPVLVWGADEVFRALGRRTGDQGVSSASRVTKS